MILLPFGVLSRNFPAPKPLQGPSLLKTIRSGSDSRDNFLADLPGVVRGTVLPGIDWVKSHKTNRFISNHCCYNEKRERRVLRIGKQTMTRFGANYARGTDKPGRQRSETREETRTTSASSTRSGR